MKHSPARGFTLIELMVIATIVGMLVSGAAVAYFKFQNKVDVVATGQRFESILKKADGMARNRVKIEPCSGTDEFKGYRVTVAAGSMDAKLKKMCGGTFVEVESVLLNENTSVARDPNTNLEYTFYTLQLQSQNPFEKSDNSVKFSLSGDTALYTVTINEIGIVSGLFSRQAS